MRRHALGAAGRGRAAAFAAGVVGRHHPRGTGAVAPLARVYHRAPAIAAVRRLTQVRLAPTFRISVVAAALPKAAAPRDVTTMAAPLSAASRVLLPVERVLAHERTRLVDRLVAREVRVEVPTSPAAMVRTAIERTHATLGAHRPARLAVAPVERVFRRSPAPPAEPRSDVDTVDGWGTASLPRRAPAAVPFGTAELDRLADHVIRSIDRRVAAHRERRGRG